MKLRTVLSASFLAAAVVFVAPTAALAATCDYPYFPIKAGASWTYTNDMYSNTQHTIAIERVDDAGYTQVLTNGRETTRTRWRCGPNGISSADPVLVSESQGVKKVVRRSGVIFPARFKLWATWTFSTREETTARGRTTVEETVTTYKVIAEDQVTVPSGRFRAFRVRVKTSVPSGSLLALLYADDTVWYAPGVGVVKRSGGSGLPLVLLRYRI